MMMMSVSSLGSKPTRRHLQRDHEDDRVQVVEDRQNTSFLVDPSGGEASGGQHREQYAGGGRGGEAPDEERFFNAQIENPPEVSGCEEPRNRCGTHSDKGIGAVLPEVRLVDVKFHAHLDHDVSEEDHG